MPELPEVETIAKALREGGRGGAALVGRRVLRAELLWQRSLAEPAPEEFAARLAGQAVRGVGRRGKFLLLQLEPDTLVIHLRMSGDLRVEDSLQADGQPVPVQPHDRALLHFADGLRLAFNDPRKFGRMWLVSDPERVTGSLGPEPFDPALDAGGLYRKLRSTSRQLKPLLLDQTFLAGVGNIYSDESLHLAKLHPLRRAGSLTPEEAARLLEAIRTTLSAAIVNNGSSFDWVYREGAHQNHFRVYQRSGQPCPVCQTLIERIVVGQRGTHFCPVCQVLF